MKAERYLYDNYGRADLIGFKYVVYILNKYDDIENLEDVYKDLAEHFHTNRMNIQRPLRYYIKSVDEEKNNKEFIKGIIIEYKGVK